MWPGREALVDRQFSDPVLASLYDAFCEGRPDFGFYLPLVMSAGSVLDLGCGTGALLIRARESGHDGLLCGVDPASAMLEQARRRTDIEWLLGDATAVRSHQEFDLVVMTGHAFQVLLGDEQARDTLRIIASALTDTGCFVFETRNSLAREWEEWNAERAVEVVDHAGAVVRMTNRFEGLDGDLVSFTSTFSSPSWSAPRASRSTLRFLDKRSLRSLLSDAGLVIEEQFGDWNREQLTDASREIITIARRRHPQG